VEHISQVFWGGIKLQWYQQNCNYVYHQKIICNYYKTAANLEYESVKFPWKIWLTECGLHSVHTLRTTT